MRWPVGATVVLAAAMLPASVWNGQSAAAGEAAGVENGLYAELGGAGIIPTVNLERVLDDAFTARAGVSLLGFFMTGNVLAPVTASYLLGHGKHRLELGGGVTLHWNRRSHLSDDRPHPRWYIPSGMLGYRYRPARPGTFLRVAFTPLLLANGWFPMGGVALGSQF